LGLLRVLGRRQPGRRPEPDRMPAVAQLGRSPEGRRTVSPDPDRRGGGLGRGWGGGGAARPRRGVGGGGAAAGGREGALTGRTDSSVTAPRSAKGGLARAWNSSGHHPTPQPTMTRPPEQASRVASCLAVTTGFR